MPCVYETEATHTDETASKQKTFDDVSPKLESDAGVDVLPPDDANILETPESRSRRLLELELLHNFLTDVVQPFPTPQNPHVRQVWMVDIPKMAFQYDNVLYNILSISASHLLRKDPNNQKLVSERERYACLGLREQRKAVAELSPQNSDAVCFASLMILESAFVMLNERSHDPYFPPMEWLQMGRGAGSVFSVALGIAKEHKDAKILIVVNAPPKVDDDETLESEELRKPFLNLLKPNLFPGHEEVWGADTIETYSRTLSYLGAIQASHDNNEPVFAVGRWLMAFPLVMPDRFLDFVEEMRPRALIILAHYFAIAVQLDSVWWLGNTALGEVVGIQKYLPRECQKYLREPLVRAKLSPLSERR